MDNLVNLVSRVSLHEDEENQHEMRTIFAEAEAFLPADGIDPAIVYRKTDGLEVDCYVPLFLKVC